MIADKNSLPFLIVRNLDIKVMLLFGRGKEENRFFYRDGPRLE